jgi:protein tyrosine phosphatase (PTP) superfamily phosphohydrolase (DUF442 family)
MIGSIARYHALMLGKMRRVFPAFPIVIVLLAPAHVEQKPREQVEGVTNFGRVTELYFRGGTVTTLGISHLAEMGVRTIIDLRDKDSPGEPEAAARNGVRYFRFPMNGKVTPDDKEVNEILSIIQNARAPVYVHCSAGKHRAGTIAALYRIRVQGWSQRQAWREEQFYGFGSPDQHPKLFDYVYRNLHEAAAASGVMVTAAMMTPERMGKQHRSPIEPRSRIQGSEGKYPDPAPRISHVRR